MLNTISAATEKLLAMSMLPGVGAATLRSASQVRGFETKSIAEIAASAPRLRAALTGGALSNAVAMAEEQTALSEREGCQILSPLDAGYPELLSTSQDDPCLIWVRGALSSTPAKSVAIVGTREPTEHGKHLTRQFTRSFTEHGWSVVSGLAPGCDSIAHR